jgi:hypothetical protein
MRQRQSRAAGNEETPSAEGSPDFWIGHDSKKTGRRRQLFRKLSCLLLAAKVCFGISLAGRISFFGQLCFLTLLHSLVEERVEERRLATFHVVP